MPPKPRRITPAPQRIPLPIEARQGTERSILGKLRRSIVGIEQEGEVVVPDIAARRVDGLE